MMFKAGCFFVMLAVGSIAFPLNEEKDMSIFFNNPVDPLIIGGVLAEPVAHMVALTTGIFAKGFLCGGSIVNEHLVLTAAHCIRGITDDKLPSSLRGNVGSNTWETSTIEHRFSHAIVHPNYIHNLIKNDIAFLVTVSAIAFTDNVQPVVLNFDFIEAGAPAIVNGWGRIDDDYEPAEDLMEFRPFIVDGQLCISEVARVAAQEHRNLPPVDPEIEICAFLEKNTGTCHGDSGSALLLEENKQQIGVTSWAVTCALGAPDMYARVSAYKTWIEEILQQTV